VMHRNSFLDSPKALLPTLNLRARPDIYVAGQLTGFEGYMESAASGLLAARFLEARLRGAEAKLPPPETMLGSLLRYIASPNSDFQPMGANMGALPPLERKVKNKDERYVLLSKRALDAMTSYIQTEKG